MKIDYDSNLYKQIANLSVDDIVQIKNRKGFRTWIHITNITNLTWQQLQLLMPEGPDRFSKMFHLYQRYRSQPPSKSNNAAESALTPSETREIQDYVAIFRDNRFQDHKVVNDYISENNLWNNFKTIRSLNDHREYKRIPGIQPKYFEIICQLLSISGNSGRALDAFHKY